MILHWLKTGWRSLIANPLFSLITIASLSVGCCGALLAGANIRQHLSFDRWVPGADHVLLLRQRDYEGDAPTQNADDVWTPGVFETVGKMPGVVDRTILITHGSLELDPKPDAKGAAYESASVMGNYFDFFSLHFLEGSARTAFAAPNQFVVTERVAREHFGAPPWVGKTAALDPNETNGVSTLTIGGVISTFPVESHRQLDIFSSLGPFETALSPGGSGAHWDFDVSGGQYVRLSPDVNVPAFQSMLKAEVEKAATEGARAACRTCRLTLESLPLPAIHLAGRRDSAIESTGETTMLLTLGSGAAALLIVSAFNFITLSLARSLKRRKEVALRKVVGADQGVIMRHYLAESLLITTISLAIGFGLAELLHPWFARQLGQPDELFSLYDPVFLGSAVAAGLMLAVIVGAYPSLYLAHVRPRAGLDKGEEHSGLVAKLVSGGLLGLQIGAATVLLAIALTMGAQSQYVAARPLGYSMANMISVTAYCQLAGASPGAGTEVGCDRVFLGPTRATPGVVQATRAAANDLFSDQATPSPVTRPGRVDVVGKAHFIANETDFLQMMNVTVLAGRVFDTASAFDRQLLDKRQPLNTAVADRIPIVVTRAFLPLIGARTPQDAVGQLVASSEIASKVGAFEIVGVIEDWHRRTLRFAVEPIVFTPGGAQMQIVAKVAPEVKDTIKETLQAQTSQASLPGVPLFTGVRPLDDDFETSYSGDRRVMLAVANFAALAVIVAGLGVFALSAFDIQRRVREIGIRKALGAAPASVAGMVMGRALRSALIASILSWPVAWWLSNAWLNGFVYRTDLGWVVLPAATAIVLAFVALAVSFNTARAAATRPDSTLRAAT